ncbi:GNAT family N-acetyltransferase [Paucibacter soli]|uniref:GNAT family N-acetyltransferase n=1 Tax=Paucibacter soli TaxID=3133433 RepID=UPI0030B070ED
MLDAAPLADDLALRAEQAGLNASAPPQEAWVDGWLIRLSPGKAKRSRCINALQAGSLPLDELLARCQASFDAAGLPLVLRITPYSQPSDLDRLLAERGWFEFDAADVMVREHLLDAGWKGLPEGQVLRALDAASYAQTVGALRGSSASEIAAHAERLLASAVPYQGFMLQRSADGALLCCGQFAREDAMVGLFDIFTPAEQRGQGHAEQLCRALLQEAASQGARQAYLQVGAENAVAQRLYARLGFVWAYRYHYRSHDPRAAD